jgi:hypothetical protein
MRVILDRIEFNMPHTTKRTPSSFTASGFHVIGMKETEIRELGDEFL